MKKIAFFSFIGLSGYLIFQLCVGYLNDGFSLNNIRHQDPVRIGYTMGQMPTDSLKKILDQDFHYLAKGSQCFVFESEDRQVVLKFFRENRYRLPKICDFTIYPQFLTVLFQNLKAKKAEKKEQFFQSCLIAYRELREDCNLIYLHLNPTDHIKQKIRVYDKLQRPFYIDCDKHAFLIQKRGTPLLPYLHILIEQGNKNAAKDLLFQTTFLLLRRMNKGILDRDSVIEKNAGFDGKKAFFVDVGSFYRKNPSQPDENLKKTTAHLIKWLHARDPELALFFLSCSEKFVADNRR